MKTYEKIFDILSQADDYVNGEKIAQELGVSELHLESHSKTGERRHPNRIRQEPGLSIDSG